MNLDKLYKQLLLKISESKSASYIHILLIFFFFVPGNSYGQLTEIGFQIGAMNYTGDLSSGYSIKNHRPAASVFLRNNISDGV